MSSVRGELSSLEYSLSHSTQAAPLTHASQNRLLLREGGSLNCMWDVQTESGRPVFFVPFRKDRARMNGKSQPNQI